MRVSTDNGNTYQTAHEIADTWLKGSRWDAIVHAMDDEAREAAHAAVAPCSARDFLAAYLARADSDLVVG
jgi:hypothetical protein